MRNQKLTQYRSWRLWPVHMIAKLFGVLVHVNGIPFGSSRNVLYVQGVDGSVGPRPGGDAMLDGDSIELLRTSIARWIEAGDLSQAHLLSGATHEAARVISILIKAEQPPSEVESTPSSRPAEAGKCV